MKENYDILNVKLTATLVNWIVHCLATVSAERSNSTNPRRILCNELADQQSAPIYTQYQHNHNFVIRIGRNIRYI